MRVWKIYVIAGEVSGDAMAARLMQALRHRLGDDGVEFFGIGGEAMQAEGLRSLFRMQELSLMGLVEILPRLPRLLRAVAKTVADIKKLKVDMLITVDVPDFSLRVAKRVCRRDLGEHFLKVHYVAPTVWVWRRGRARIFAKAYDHILCLLPFEPPYFESEGLTAHFIGHPLWEFCRNRDDELSFRKRHNIPESALLLLLLAGSRDGEVSLLMPIFNRAAQLLRQQRAVSKQEFRVMCLTLPHLQDKVRALSDNDVLIVADECDKYPAFAAADMALAASGTVALELARAGTPYIIAHKMNPLTAIILRQLLRTKYVSLPNILAGRAVMDEFLQAQCRAEILAQALHRLSDTKPTENIAAARRQVEKLQPPLAKPTAKKPQTPSAYAADVLYRLLQRSKDEPHN